MDSQNNNEQVDHRSDDVAGPAGGPPPTPKLVRHVPTPSPRRESSEPEWMGPDPVMAFEKEFGPIEQRPVVRALLRAPARIVYELVQGRAGKVWFVTLIALVVCMAFYGFVTGAFSGGSQLWAVPLKLVAGSLLSAAICLPSLYIFSCVSGGKQSFQQLVGILTAAMALTAVLLVGFAPVTWLFSQSTNATWFMGCLHILFWSASAYFGLRMLHSALTFLNKRHLWALRLWIIVFIAVSLQMTTTLRPLVGDYEVLKLDEKKFFTAHWRDSIGS